MARLNRLPEALASLDKALEIKPRAVEVLCNRAVALANLMRYPEALESIDAALRIRPDSVAAHWTLSVLLLQHGQFARGWEEFEWRWLEDQQKAGKRDFPQPLWRGDEPLHGKTMLLHSELGLGDTLQFCRYGSLVSGLGAKVVLEVQPELLGLLKCVAGTIDVLARGAALPGFDFHCPLLSLPLAFKSDMHSIPAHIPYVRSNQARVAAWTKTLGNKTGPRVGLVWRGSATHKNDYNRRMALSELLPLFIDRFEWIGLQKEVHDDDSAFLVSTRHIRNLGTELNEFGDTAALVDLMDLVITVDTSVAHLAGAMGKVVWLLLPFNPDWR